MATTQGRVLRGLSTGGAGQGQGLPLGRGRAGSRAREQLGMGLRHLHEACSLSEACLPCWWGPLRGQRQSWQDGPWPEGTTQVSAGRALPRLWAPGKGQVSLALVSLRTRAENPWPACRTQPSHVPEQTAGLGTGPGELWAFGGGAAALPQGPLRPLHAKAQRRVLPGLPPVPTAPTSGLQPPRTYLSAIRLRAAPRAVPLPPIPACFGLTWACLLPEGLPESFSEQGFLCWKWE